MQYKTNHPERQYQTSAQQQMQSSHETQVAGTKTNEILLLFVKNSQYETQVCHHALGLVNKQ